jgi:hypothetical protein
MMIYDTHAALVAFAFCFTGIRPALLVYTFNISFGYDDDVQKDYISACIDST